MSQTIISMISASDSSFWIFSKFHAKKRKTASKGSSYNSPLAIETSADRILSVSRMLERARASDFQTFFFFAMLFPS